MSAVLEAFGARTARFVSEELELYGIVTGNGSARR